MSPRQVVARLDGPRRPVPEDPPRLPGRDAARELLGVKPAGRPRRGRPPAPAIAEAVWWPCVSDGSGEKRVMITSGRKRRMTATTSASMASLPQMRSVSSGLFE